MVTRLERDDQAGETISMIEELKNYIDGRWRESAGRGHIEDENPAERGSILAHAQNGSAEDIDAAVSAAAKAFKEWREFPLAGRQDMVAGFLDGLRSNRAELARIVASENGKTLKEAAGEIDSALLEGRHHLQQVAVFAGESPPRGHSAVKAWDELHPLGAVGVISPWNYPVNVMCRKTLPALLTGNTVVFKPASFTPWSSIFMARMFEQAGIPDGVFNCVTGDGGVVGNTLVRNPAVRAISFTGSTAVGRKIQSLAALDFTRTQLELGGKNAMIVLGDADLDAAVDAAVKAGFGCAGQWCTSTSRILLDRAIAADFTERLVARCQAMVVGDPLEAGTEMGPVAGPSQFKNISVAIESGSEEGARMLTGGVVADSGGYFIRPTVFDGVTRDMSIFREEIFGPVVAVSEIDGIDAALEWANDSCYGLSSTIFTNDLDYALKYVRGIEAGMAHVNIHSGYKTPELPFGGWKESGFGPPENGRSGLAFFVQSKSVYMRGI